MLSILLVKNFGGLVKKTFRLIHACYSLPVGQAVKVTLVTQVFLRQCTDTGSFLLIYINLTLLYSSITPVESGSMMLASGSRTTRSKPNVLQV